MPQVVGIVAIQGDFEKHAESLRRLDPAIDVRFVRTPEELEPCDRLIIPGGESTTVGKLMDRFGLGPAIQGKAARSMPIWGTCMGMIMMAREVEGHQQYSLNLLDITVRRNAFGAQVHSFEDRINVKDVPEPVMGVFIRAPIVTEMGQAVAVIAEYEGKVVGVREGRKMGTSFHPELTLDTQLHQYFLDL